MKIKPISTNNDGLLRETRFNDRINSKYTDFRSSIGNASKREYCTTLLMSLMYERGFLATENPKDSFNKAQDFVSQMDMKDGNLTLRINDVLKFNTNSEYLIVDIVNRKYLLLVNNNKYENDTAIVKTAVNNNEIEINRIENDEEFDYVLNKLYLDFKKEVLSLLD